MRLDSKFLYFLFLYFLFPKLPHLLVFVLYDISVFTMCIYHDECVYHYKSNELVSLYALVIGLLNTYMIIMCTAA